FKDFCNVFREDVIALLASKLVQTNEVRRCGYLFPSFSCIYNKVNRPLALVEIGTSAGLQLLFDQYRYSYRGKGYGNPVSPVHITSDIIGENRPPIPTAMPPVAARIGLDLHINDVSDSADFHWLEAL